MAEAKKMSQLVGQDRFQVVAFGMSAERERRCKSGVGVAGIEVNIRIQTVFTSLPLSVITSVSAK
jgi:hypothetical protein